MNRILFPRTILLGVFFLSGFAGLGYQVVWGHWLHTVFGASAWALAAILSAFMAGLALGGFTAGRLGDRLRIDPLLAYGIIEVLIGAWALLFPQLLDGAMDVQGRFFFQWVEQHTLYGLIRFGLCFLILLVPTSLMGATFPILSAYVANRSTEPTRWVGWLYGLNTAGAFAGTVAAGFLLIASLGLVNSNLLLAAINFGVGLGAILAARAGVPGPDKEKSKLSPPPESPAPVPAGTRDPISKRADLYRLILAIFLANGIFNLAHEVLWARALALIIGTTTYALSVMLAVFLAGIAGGSLWMTRRLGKLRDPLGVLLGIQAAMALWVLVSPLLVNALPYLFLKGLWTLGIGWASSVVLKCLLCALLLLPLTLGMGAAFPLGVHLAFRNRAGLASEVGDLYGINTAGGILGAFAAGFVLVPLVGVEKGLAVTAIGHLAVVLALVMASGRGRAQLRRHRWRWGLVGIVALSLPLVTGWNPLLLASGVYFQPRLFYDTDGRVMLAERMSQASLRYHAEGANATVDVLEAPGGFRALTINGKPVATSNYYDYRVQRLLGVLPLLLHPEPRRILVIGLGTGMTAGTGSIDPATESLEIIEITAEVVGATEHFREWNLDVVHNPMTRILTEDATHYLRFVGKRYDVITSDPIHPFVSGAGDLYSVESYAVARSKLASGGVFCQWVPLYQLDKPDIDSIMRTFDEVWENATVWVTGKDFILCGARDAYLASFASIQRKFDSAAYTEVLQLLGFWTPEEVFSAYIGRLGSLRQLFASAAVNSVVHPFLEFSAPRSIFRNTDADNLARVFGGAQSELPEFLADTRPGLFRGLEARRACTELVWAGFIADRGGDLAAAARLSRQAYDRCPQLGYVRHFAAHTIQAYSDSIRADDPARALNFLRRARGLDPYTPEIAAATARLEAEIAVEAR